VTSQTPQRVTIVGAGVVGLSTAWFLQSRGIDVTVIDRAQPGAGASWGNAGWVTPALVAPLPDPAVLRYGLRAALAPSGPVGVSLRLPQVRFLMSLLAHCTARHWRTAMAALAPLTHIAIDAFDELSAGGVQSPVIKATPMLAAFRRETESVAIVAELETAHRLGARVEFGIISGADARAIEPSIGPEIETAVTIGGQRYLDPGAYVVDLATQFVAHGGQLRTNCALMDIVGRGGRPRLTLTAGEVIESDAVVVATGAWLGRLRRRLGIGPHLGPGRGYSFSVATPTPASGPLYFPAQRIACTPIAGDRLRVAGVMEFAAVDAPLRSRRIRDTVAAARGLLALDLEARAEEWLGARPVTADGLPLIGRTRLPAVYVAGGHGMWGITLGPATGRLLAAMIATGVADNVLTPFDPARR
jgi:D-amino-acid dehydrogenase